MYEVRYCAFCGSVNHIQICTFFPAWECWNCLNKHWLDDDHMEYDLLDDSVPMLYGQSER